VNRTLTIVGSSARAAACSAVQAGFSVRAGDLFADADLCRIANVTRVANYPAGLAAVVGGEQDGAWMYTGALENHAALVGRLARMRPLWGNGAAVLRGVRNPQRVADALGRAGHCAPAVRLDPRDVPRDGTWLVKPRRSAGGTRIGYWTASRPPGPPPRGCYYQQYVEGMPCSAVYLAAGDRAALVGVTRQLIGQAWAQAGGFRYCGSVGPVRLPNEAMASLEEIGQVLARDFHLVGLFGVDAIINAAGVWPLEVNPRYTASVEVLERAGLAGAIGLHAAACDGQRLPEVGPLAGERVSGKAILFASSPTTVTTAWSERASQALDPRRRLLADIPAGGTTIEAGWPIVTIFADAAAEAVVVASLRDMAASVLAEW
jgi:predicted ATP-grasp superfamily ATP-dependent carboligase